MTRRRRRRMSNPRSSIPICELERAVLLPAGDLPHDGRDMRAWCRLCGAGAGGDFERAVASGWRDELARGRPGRQATQLSPDKSAVPEVSERTYGVLSGLGDGALRAAPRPGLRARVNEDPRLAVACRRPRGAKTWTQAAQ